MLESIYKVNADGTGEAIVGPFHLQQQVWLIATTLGVPNHAVRTLLENGEWVATGGTGAFYCKADANGNKLANGPCPVQMLIDERKTILADYEQLPHPAHDRPIEDFELEARRHEAGIRY